MGAIARNIANKITTSGVFTSGAIANSSVTGITALANASDGITFISSQTASNSASISFTSGLDSTYKAYKFVFTNINPVDDNIQFQFNLSTDGGSNYNVTKTSTLFYAFHQENDAGTDFSFESSSALDQSTGFQNIAISVGFDADQSASGSLILFNPSSTTYVKHWISNVNNTHASDANLENFSAGYANTTSAINAIQFRIQTGNFDGTIALYGIK